MAPCTGNNVTRTCAHRQGAVSATQLRFETVGGDDKIDTSGLALPFDGSLPAEFVTAGGNDTIVGGPVFDNVFAGPGDDRITGGAGADVLRGEDGADVFLGLDGEDTVSAAPASTCSISAPWPTGGIADLPERRGRRRAAGRRTRTSTSRT